MNKHVKPLEPDDRKTDGFAPRFVEIVREEAFLDIPRAQIDANKSLLVGVGVE
jgi:hypothetical protein